MLLSSVLSSRCPPSCGATHDTFTVNSAAHARSSGVARGARPEGTVLQYGPGEPGAASGVRPRRRPAPPAGSRGRRGARMTDLPYVHIGIVVRDLEAAIERFSLLGLTFMDPLTVHVDRLVEGERETELDLTVVFSHQGPPHWELLRAAGDGIYGPQHADRLHHVAVLDADPARKRGELVQEGLREVAAQYRA